MEGWDCFGLYRYVLAEQKGLLVPSYSEAYSGADVDAHEAMGHVLPAYWSRIAPGEAVEGDGVVFVIGGVPAHCGYIIEPGTMLHSLKGRDTCMERYTSPAWNKRIEGFYRWNS